MRFCYTYFASRAVIPGRWGGHICNQSLCARRSTRSWTLSRASRCRAPRSSASSLTSHRQLSLAVAALILAREEFGTDHRECSAARSASDAVRVVTLRQGTHRGADGCFRRRHGKCSCLRGKVHADRNAGVGGLGCHAARPDPSTASCLPAMVPDTTNKNNIVKVSFSLWKTGHHQSRAIDFVKLNHVV